MDSNEIYEKVKELGFSEFLCENSHLLTSEEVKYVFFGFYDSVYDLIGREGIEDLLPAGLKLLAEQFRLDR